MSEVAEDLKAIFEVRREKRAKALAEEFVSAVQEALPEGGFHLRGGERGCPELPLRYPGSHHARIRTTNVLEGLFTRR